MAHSSESRAAPIAEFVPELDRLAADAMADWKVPAAALAVVQDGKVTHIRACKRLAPHSCPFDCAKAVFALCRPGCSGSC